MVISEYSKEEIIKISALKLTLWEKIKLNVIHIFIETDITCQFVHATLWHKL